MWPKIAFRMDNAIDASFHNVLTAKVLLAKPIDRPAARFARQGHQANRIRPWQGNPCVFGYDYPWQTLKLRCREGLVLFW
jgi:hypothetical protein